MAERQEYSPINLSGNRRISRGKIGAPGNSEHLWTVVIRKPTDFEPYGFRIRENNAADCASGCRFFLKLASNLGLDWGVCSNPLSPRSGLLTFEHMGCQFSETDPKIEEKDEIETLELLEKVEKGESTRT